MIIITAIIIFIASLVSATPPIENDLDTSNIAIADWCELHHSDGTADVFFDTVEGASVDAWNDWNDDLQKICGPSHTVSA